MAQDPSFVMSRSRIALATLITVSVLGSFYYHTHQPGKKADKDTLYNDFLDALPVTPEDEANDFLGSLFKNASALVPSTLEEFKSKMASVYPAFERQMEAIRHMYSSFWDYLFLEDFRKIVKESLNEDDDVILHPEIQQEALVREGQGLSEAELEFIKKRKERMRAAFAFFIGEDEVEVDDIPNIGIASSGGGYRAMVACSGYLHAFNDTGLLDCALYMAGVSGSTWAMSQFYSPLTHASVETLKDHLSSRIHTHIANLSNFLTILNASRHNAKILLHGVIQRYYQQNGSISLVDVFGMLLGGTLLTKKVIVDSKKKEKADEEEEYSESISLAESTKTAKTGTVEEDDGAQVRPRVLQKNEVKLSKQKKYFEDGSLPMPIYCAVRHEIHRPGITKQATMSSIPEEKDEEESEEKEGKEETPKDLYQWYEFTPYEMGSEEINAWIPIWSFGRKFKEGKNIEKLPEQSIGVLMGMFGSAFVASLAHFYQEIRLLLPEAAIQKADEMIQSYQSSVSTIHPISPASFPNPFYKMPAMVQTKDEEKEEILRSENLVGSEQIELMDAGMDNNIPFYPLLRKGRDVDIIISVDSSADIQDAPHFDRAEGYVKRRGIKGWPRGAGWPKKKETSHDPIEINHKQKNKSSTSKYSLDTCTVFSSSSTEITPEDKDSVKTTYPENTNPITLVYFPLIVNNNYDPEFDPQAAEFCSTWNFVYTTEQVNKLHGLSVANVKDNIEKVRKVVKEVWKRKREERLRKSE
ncbi:hypothetical protein G6F46_007140 [Rhizopus delemar]|uniref:Lysophospholipase n=2 Tax=Rhizopus TaxID=4842 RepID=A0A9P6Z7J6_9FUNG|nr:hypothetical protein G6F55_004590 [Rhizopus delemar]KAG1542420.1 hypothetical protein G6F51_007282 [Rhizopus arrhizus]KAG1496436.1 hypothetical protein G6F54_006473 [Rhizopus delemar]KAG1513722.1 hypothetical protein G6F53_004216 [Rhizopus delemar]KAG1525780.1 hypothetical protein G6F52_003018 [Rhizopus delemar]